MQCYIMFIPVERKRPATTSARERKVNVHVSTDVHRGESVIEGPKLGVRVNVRGHLGVRRYKCAAAGYKIRVKR